MNNPANCNLYNSDPTGIPNGDDILIFETSTQKNLFGLDGVAIDGMVFNSSENDVVDAVVGTFAGLSENEEFTVAGVTYEISYKGGDGNDVVLNIAATSEAGNSSDNDGVVTPGIPKTGVGTWLMNS